MKAILKRIIEKDNPLWDKKFISEIAEHLIVQQEFQERSDLELISEDDFTHNYNHGTLRLPQRRKLAAVIRGKFFQYQISSTLYTHTNEKFFHRGMLI